MFPQNRFRIVSQLPIIRFNTKITYHLHATVAFVAIGTTSLISDTTDESPSSFVACKNWASRAISQNNANNHTIIAHTIFESNKITNIDLFVKLSCGGDWQHFISGDLAPSLFSPRTRPSRCMCEFEKNVPAPTSTPCKSTPRLKPLSYWSLLLLNCKITSHSSLPCPRILSAHDPVFSYPELKRGLARRRKDEAQLRTVASSVKAQEARDSKNPENIQAIMKEMSVLVYGEGVTPQIREEFLMQYGCTGYTPSVIEYLVELGKERGIVEVGAGNGQWARALSDYYQNQKLNNNRLRFSQNGNSSRMMRTPKQEQIYQKRRNLHLDFILAYDNMEDLPLSPQIYHNRTVPARDFFYDNVQKCTSHIDAVQGYAARGRVLLLVYPPPGSMALETVQAYVRESNDTKTSGTTASYKKNDTVVYVGEGRGGANADEAFFDYLLGIKNDGQSKENKNTIQPENEKRDQWILVKEMGVKPCPGGKGYEKLFVFKKL